MPIYTFKCNKCGNELEQLLKIHEIETAHISCDNCSESEMIRIYDTCLPPIFTGGGWAKDNYCKPKTQNKEE